MTPKVWGVLLLLTFAIGISFIDRGALAIALGSIKRELYLAEDQLGWLSAAFFLSYSVMQLFVGKMLERIDAIRLYAFAFGLWSLATAATGVTRELHFAGVTVHGLQVLFFLRLVLGCGESVTYPATAAIITRTVPEGLRGTANSLVDAGSKVGPALGIMLGTSILAKSGWRAMFVWLGLTSLLWVPLWLASTRSISARLKHRDWAPRYAQIAAQRSFWGASLGHVGGNYAWALFVSWLPYFFERSGHFSASQLVWLSSAPFWALSLSSVSSGYLSDRLIRAGGPPIFVRKTTVTLGCLGTAVCLFAASYSHSMKAAILAIVCASFCLGMFSSNNWALAQALSGAAACGKWTSLQNVIANLSSFVAAWATGALLARTGSFSAGFLLAAAVLLAGSFAYWFGIQDREQVVWTGPSGKGEEECVRV